MNVFVKLLLACLLVLVTQHVFKLVLLMGFHRHLYNHYPGSCHSMEGMDFGSEDMFMTPDGLVFITSGFQSESASAEFRQRLENNNVKGRILLFDLRSLAKTVTPLKIKSTETFDADKFYPHGISGFVDASGSVLLFVVNHAYNLDRVEKFQYLPEKQELQHLRYYSNPAMKQVNDIGVTDANSFYFSNWQLSRSGLYNTLQTMLFLPWTSVGFCSEKDCQIHATGFLSANGVTASSDGKYVYVADSFGKELRVFSRQPNNSLLLMQTYPLHTHPDNIFIDKETGDVYLGCHPIGHEIMTHLANPKSHPKSTSQVLRLKTKEGMVESVEEVFLDDGSMISGSAIAVVFKQRMLIGSVTDKMVYCDLATPK